MKILNILFVFSIIITGCSKEVKQVAIEETEENEKNQKNTVNIIKNNEGEFKESNIEMILANEVKEGTKIYITGTVGVVNEDIDKKSFTFYSNNFSGSYIINDVRRKADYEHGENLRVFGTYLGNDKNNWPVIDSLLIEKE